MKNKIIFLLEKLLILLLFNSCINLHRFDYEDMNGNHSLYAYSTMKNIHFLELVSDNVEYDRNNSKFIDNKNSEILNKKIQISNNDNLIKYSWDQSVAYFPTIVNDTTYFKEFPFPVKSFIPQNATSNNWWLYNVFLQNHTNQKPQFLVVNINNDTTHYYSDIPCYAFEIYPFSNQKNKEFIDPIVILIDKATFIPLRFRFIIKKNDDEKEWIDLVMTQVKKTNRIDYKQAIWR
jgi:hypothetical protein